MVEPLVFGVELGGTKTIAVAARGRAIVDMITISTDDPQTTLAPIVERLDSWSDAFGAPQALGIASFGPLALDPDAADYGHITTTPKPGWRDFDVLGHFRQMFDGPIGFDTDVACAALAEYRWGAARDCETALYLTIGTGIGGGVIVAGKPIHGLMHPEIGHLRIRRAAGDTFPGICPYHGDCLEGLASGPAIAARAKQDSRLLSSDHPVWRSVAAELAEAIAMLLLAVSPRRILIGGGVSHNRAFLLLMIRARVLELLNGYLSGITAERLRDVIRMPDLSDLAGPSGAIAIALATLDQPANVHQIGARPE